LQSLTYGTQKLVAELEQMIAEEVNVKQVVFTDTTDDGFVTIDKHITPELRREGLMREVIRNVQAARKKAGLEVDDRIQLALLSHHNDLFGAIHEHAEIIKQETLATDLVLDSREYQAISDCKVEGMELVIGLQKTA